MKKLLSLATATLAVICLFASCGGQFEQNQPEQNQPAHIHSFGEWETTKKATCSTDGEQTRFCDCGEAQTKSVPATEHTIVIDSAVEATCTETGLTEGKHCSVCSKVLIAQNVIAMKPHTEVIDEVVEATCTATGLTEGKHCSVCNTVIIAQNIIPASHKYSGIYEYNDEYHWLKCTVCGNEKSKGEHIIGDEDICMICDPAAQPTEGIIYDIFADGTYAVVIGCVSNGISTKVKIAEEYNGLPVKRISKDAFGCNDAITAVVIPDSVTIIDGGAFWDCDSLTSVVIGDGVTFISQAFAYCDSLSSVVIGDSVISIGFEAFRECVSLTSIVIPDSVTSISDKAFYWCDSLTSVVIGDSVTSIGDSAFQGCDSLSSVVIPDSITSIGDSAFSDCSSLTSIVIPDSVTSIGDKAFYNCSSLKDVYYTGSEAEWKAIEIDAFSKYYLKYATIHYNYVPEN